jgi:hypothetical protein
MAKRSLPRAKARPIPFFPTQAYLGYPKDSWKEPALNERRREYAEFSRALRAILSPLLVNRYALHEDMLVLTHQGFRGREPKWTAWPSPALACLSSLILS